MPEFSENSQDNLATCDERLQEIFEQVVEYFDCTVLEGHRSEERQNQMVAEGKSQLSWPNSNHNGSPSHAVDVAPYPIDWSNRDRFHYFAGYVMGTAQSLGYPLRWGGDWDSDTETNDNKFDDLVHFELVER